MSAQHDAATCFCQPGLFIRAFWQPREKPRHEDPVSVSSLLPAPLSLSPTISPKLCLFLHPREKCKRLINRSSFHNFEDQIGFRIVFFHFQTWVPLIFLDFSRRSYIDSWIIERLLSGSINNSDITGWFAYGRKMEKIDGAGQMADTVSRFPGFCLLDYASFASGHLGFRGLARSVYSYARLFGSRRP